MMKVTPFASIVTADSAFSSSTDRIATITTSGYIQMASHVTSYRSLLSSSIPKSLSEDSININEETTPSPTTPVTNYDITTPIKNIPSLDLEMCSRKRRRRITEDDFIVHYSSPTTSLSLPILISLEDCVDSHRTCLPDTSFLRRKKQFRRRRPTIFWSWTKWMMDESVRLAYGDITSRNEGPAKGRTYQSHIQWIIHLFPKLL